MANLKFIAQTTEQALTAATKKTVLQVTAPSNQRVKVLGWGVYFDGINTTILATAADTTTKPAVEAVLATGTTGGTFSNTLSTLDGTGSCVISNGSNGTIQSIAEAIVTGEPTETGVLDVAEVNPANGGYMVMFEKDVIPVVNGGDFVSINCTAPDGVNVRAKLFCEE